MVGKAWIFSSNDGKSPKTNGVLLGKRPSSKHLLRVRIFDVKYLLRTYLDP
jgi:hypothetical protein